MRVRAVDYVLFFTGIMASRRSYDQIDGLSIMMRILEHHFCVGTTRPYSLTAAWNYFDISAPGIH